MPIKLFKLFEVHAKLDRELRREERRRLPDGLRVKRLKKLKLAIKDRLARGLPPTLQQG